MYNSWVFFIYVDVFSLNFFFFFFCLLIICFLLVNDQRFSWDLWDSQPEDVCNVLRALGFFWETI